MLIGVIVVVFVGVLASLLVEGDDPAPAAEDSAAVTSVDVTLVGRDDGLYLPQPDRLLLARVDHVIDGDTLDVIVAGETHRVRLFGVAAAERDERCYAEATEELRRLSGSEVRLLADTRREDEFGRWLRYVFTPEGRSIDAALVASGAASAWRDDGAYRDRLVRLEQAAREAGDGCLWGR